MNSDSPMADHPWFVRYLPAAPLPRWIPEIAPPSHGRALLDWHRMTPNQRRWSWLLDLALWIAGGAVFLIGALA